MKARITVTWIMTLLATLFWFSALPAFAQQNCSALERLDRLIADWEAQETIHPSRLEALKIISNDLKMCLGQSSETPAGASFNFSGKWKTDYGTMELSQTGDQVEGTYEHNQGKIEGIVADDLFAGTWSEGPTYEEPQDKGDLEFVLSADGKSFTGKWRNGSKGEWNENWNGQRE